MEDDGVLVDDGTLGEDPLEAEGAESSALGGYPAVADRELAKPDESADGADDDGVLHTESRALESLDE